MTQHHLSEKSYARVGIVGFGAVGASVLAQQVAEIEHLLTVNPINPPLVEFVIYNDGDDHAHGAAYDLKNMLFCLNFPVQCQADEYNVPANMRPEEVGLVGMHLLDGQNSDLLDWIKERRAALSPERIAEVDKAMATDREQGLSEAAIAYRHPEIYRDYMLAHEWDAHSYLPRGFYREYLHDIFSRTKKHIAQINERYGFEIVKLNDAIDATVLNIADGENNGLTICAKSAAAADPTTIVQDTVDSVVIATGHHYGPLFSREIQAEPTFTNTPLGDDEIEKALGKSVSDPEAIVAIIGTGASYLDTLRNLEALDYKGKIVALSSSPTHYLPFDPRRSGAECKIDEFLQSVQGLSAAALKERLVEYVHGTYCLEVGPQNVLHALRAALPTFKPSLAPEDFEDFSALVKKLSWNRTAPETYSVFRHFQESGQLTFLSGRMKQTRRNSESDQWETTLSDGRVIYSTILCDCAGLATRVVGPRGDIADPLIRSMVQETKVAVADMGRGIAIAAPGHRNQIGFAGVAGTNERGLPFTRQIFYSAAHPTLLAAINRATARDAARIWEQLPENPHAPDWTNQPQHHMQ